MKRSDFHITNQKIIEFCRKEHRRQNSEFAPLLAKKEMSVYQANEEHLIIQLYRELAEMMHIKDLDIYQLAKLLDKMKTKKEPIQGTIKFL